MIAQSPPPHSSHSITCIPAHTQRMACGNLQHLHVRVLPSHTYPKPNAFPFAPRNERGGALLLHVKIMSNFHTSPSHKICRKSGGWLLVVGAGPVTYHGLILLCCCVSQSHCAMQRTVQLFFFFLNFLQLLFHPLALLFVSPSCHY